MNRTTLTIGTVMCLFAAGIAVAFSSGAPAGNTGAPGDASCGSCHTGALSSAMMISAPATYTAGDTLTIVITPPVSSKGFELTVLDSANAAVGSLIPGSNQQIVSGGGRQDITQSAATISPNWTMKWVAPATSGRGKVTFYAVVLVSLSGSRYNSSQIVNEAVTSCCAGKRGNVNASGIVDGADLAGLASYLTGGGFVLPCSDAANVNGIGIVDGADLASLVSFLTGGGFVLPNCP